MDQSFDNIARKRTQPQTSSLYHRVEQSLSNAKRLRVSSFALGVSLSICGTMATLPLDRGLGVAHADILAVDGSDGLTVDVLDGTVDASIGGGDATATDGTGDILAVDGSDGLTVDVLDGTVDASIGGGDATATDGTGDILAVDGINNEVDQTAPQTEDEDATETQFFTTQVFSLAASLPDPAIAAYEAYPAALSELNGLPSLRQRSSFDGRQGKRPETVNTWLFMEGERDRQDMRDSQSGDVYKARRFTVNTGADFFLAESTGGYLVGGLMLNYGSGSADNDTSYGSGRIETSGYGLGATLTWFGKNGFYADGQIRLNRFSSDLSEKSSGNVATGLEATGYAASLEIGQRLKVGYGLTVEPQAQLTLSSVDFASFSDGNGRDISLQDGSKLTGRVGATINKEWTDSDGQRQKLYGILNFHKEFGNGTAIAVDGTEYRSSSSPLAAEIGAGGEYGWKIGGGLEGSIFGEMAASRSLSNADTGLKGTVGLRLKW